MKKFLLLVLAMFLLLATGCEVSIDEGLVDAASGNDSQVKEGPSRKHGGSDYDDDDDDYGKDYDRGYDQGHSHFDGCHRDAYGLIECHRHIEVHFQDQYGNPIESTDVYFRHIATGRRSADHFLGYDGVAHISSYVCGLQRVYLTHPYRHHNRYKHDYNTGLVGTVDLCEFRKGHVYMIISRI